MRIIGSAPRMERASAPSARADMDGTIGNVMDNDTGQASITALASQPRSLHVSTGDSVDSSNISTSTGAPPPTLVPAGGGTARLPRQIRLKSAL